jgi:diaminohydroxyphosphoribosylaminopyrimidine deaminase/5-amino-6-(5-phosphoribosylamino)uracil reductase
VYGSRDPNPKASGGGEFLRARGLEVKEGVCAELERQLNRGWRNLVLTGRPFVTLKLALSSDSKLSAGRGLKTQISCHQSNRLVQCLRSYSSAILVGAETCRVDDPLLTNRSGFGLEPKRIVVSSDLKIFLEAKMLQSNAHVVCPLGLNQSLKQSFLSRGVELIELDSQDAQPNLSSLFERLGQAGLESVLVEGGAELSKSLLRSALVDRLLIFKSSDSLGGDGASLEVGDYLKTAGLELRSEKRSGSDLLSCYQRSN